MIIDLTDDQILAILHRDPKVASVLEFAEEIQERLDLARIDCDVTLAAHTITVTVDSEAGKAARLIAPGADWDVTIAGPVDVDGFHDPDTTEVAARTSLPAATVIVTGKPARRWQSVMGPGDIVEFRPRDTTHLNSLRYARTQRRLRLVDVDPLHGVTATVSDEHEGSDGPDGWEPGTWTTDVQDLRIWASADDASDFTLSADVCDGEDCLTFPNAMPAGEPHLCADCAGHQGDAL